MSNFSNIVDLFSGGLDLDAIYKTIGSNLRALRARKGMTQLELGNKLGVTAQQVQKHEKGTSKMYVHTLMALTRILNCNINTLLKREEEDIRSIKTNHHYHQHQNSFASKRVAIR